MAQFGLSHAQKGELRKRRWDEERHRRQQPRTPFAFLPTRMDDGRWVWLERYHEIEQWTDCSVCYTSNGWWSLFRKPLV